MTLELSVSVLPSSDETYHEDESSFWTVEPELLSPQKRVDIYFKHWVSQFMYKRELTQNTSVTIYSGLAMSSPK